nr:DUF4388 domain-containing protein [candidate division Zixibacteria bacterium]
MRLDEILLTEGLATGEQVDEALDYQRRFGGRLETHLYRFGYVSEVDLVSILARQFGCEGVVVSRMAIPEAVLNMIPAATVLEKLVLPYDYDPVTNRLKVACQNPLCGNLATELSDLTHGKNIELRLALGFTLQCALIKHYRNITYHNDDIAENVEQEGETNASTESYLGRYRLLILNSGYEDISQMEYAFREEGFDIRSTDSIDLFVDALFRYRPQAVVMCLTGRVEQVETVIDDVASRGFDFDELPFFLVVENGLVGKLIPLLKEGLEDVLPMGSCHESLLIKLSRIRDLHENILNQRLRIIRDIGTHGSLHDMNVIDLLQMMGHTNKTTRINITGHGQQLTIFIDNGRLIYAECDDKSGAEAVYMCIPWTNGVWSIDPIKPDQLPPANNDLPIETILLEGCRLLDERNRTENCDVADWL